MARLVVVPALITLAVTVVRLCGELAGGPARWFSTASGGGSAWLGITWLVPVFGIWFGHRLARAGEVLPRRALGVHALAVMVYIGGFQFVIRALPFDTSTRDGMVSQLLAMGAVSVLAAALAAWAWPALFMIGLRYALLARLPIVVITAIAAFAGWDVHHVKLGPKDYAGFSPFALSAWLGYVQLVFWTAFTVAIGGLFGAVAARATRSAIALPRSADDD